MPMARPKTQETQVLKAYFLPTGFVVDDLPIQPAAGLEKWIAAFAKDKYSALFQLGFMKKEPWFSPSLEYLHRFAQLLLKKLSQQPEIEFNRDAVQVDLTEDELYKLKEELPFVLGMEHVDNDWMRTVWESLLAVFKREIKTYDGTVARYFTDHNDNINVAGRVFFHLVENQEEQHPFAFLATYSTKPVKSKRAIHTPLKNALKEFDGDERKLLALISTVIKAAEKSAFISELLESGELFAPLKLTSAEAYTVLKETALYEEAGILCRVPDWWRKSSNSLRMSITVGEKAPSQIGLKAIMDCVPSLAIGDEVLTEQELRAFLNMAEGMIQYKGKWIEIDKRKLAVILQAFEKVKELSNNGSLSLGELLRLELNLNRLLDISSDELTVSVTNGQWFRTMKETLTHPAAMQKVGVEPSFHANLRAYQETGYHWLTQMAQFGFGACLADDMGLGKTVQVIAFLEYQRVHNGGQALLILPASLIGNWRKEIESFAPEMPYQILHKSDLKSSGPIQLKEGAFLYITTYGMAVRLETLKDRQWDLLIIDEAQAIKNPGSKQTKAVKAIPAQMRIAMTGTPIENRLADLWSLFDFLNQGLLGTGKEFTDFAKGLAQHATGYTKLRKMIQPFMLRRLKTDKSIIADLPDKLEMNAYPALSQKQIALYRQLLGQIEKKLEAAEGMERKGLVLASIMKFKQICNHPDHYLGREEFKPEHSGKFEQLREICETIREKRERVLIFTQFREMTEPIAEFLRSIFGKEGFVLHGGTSVKRRSEMVEQFNGERYVPYMVLSLKAGGVGLNLTAANHVIHFDRWWNPAVENQATDRAFRIGQTRNVMVHKFVTTGTIEEKIDAIIQEKQKLSGELLAAGGEQWITEYSNAELLKIFALGGDA